MIKIKYEFKNNRFRCLDYICDLLLVDRNERKYAYKIIDSFWPTEDPEERIEVLTDWHIQRGFENYFNGLMERLDYKSRGWATSTSFSQKEYRIDTNIKLISLDGTRIINFDLRHIIKYDFSNFEIVEKIEDDFLVKLKL